MNGFPRVRRRTRLVAVMAAIVVAGVLASCSSGSGVGASTTLASGSSPAVSGTTLPPAPSGILTVFAAASLKSPFTEIGDLFQQENPGSTVTYNFAGSSDLVAQIIAGAPADVFASADTTNMTRATEAGVVSGAPVDFAGNTMTIITPPGNPFDINGFADLANSDLAVVICAPQVPCGAATRKIETATGVALAPVSEESSVIDVLNKVTTGEADAGLVYVTDAAGAGDKVTTVDFPESSTVVNTYPIATLTAAADPALAEKFVDLVTGPQGQRVLAAAGFRPAP